MSKTKIPAVLLVIGAMSLGVPAMAAPVTPLSVAAKPMAESDLVQVRFGGWHGGWGGWHGGPGLAAGALAGALIGGAIAGPYYGGGYYAYDDGYGYPALPYGYAPGYSYGYAPGYYPGSYPGYGYRCHPFCRWGG
jgi:hypothetical protein